VITGDEFVSAPEIGSNTPTMEVSDVRYADMESDGKGGRRTLVVYFKGAKKGWPMNKTNPKLISAMFGNDVSGWIGKRLTLHVVPVKFGSEDTEGIRVKGSPDISQPMTISIKRPKRRPEVYRLEVTGNQPRRQSGPGNRQPQQEQADSPAEALARWASTQRGPFPWDDEGEALEQMDNTRAMYWLGKVGA